MGTASCRRWGDVVVAGQARLKQRLAALKFLYERTLSRPAEVSFLMWPKQPRPLPRVLSPESIASLLAAIVSLTYRTIAMVMYGAGLRIAEACALRVQDIDAPRGVRPGPPRRAPAAAGGPPAKNEPRTLGSPWNSAAA